MLDTAAFSNEGAVYQAVGIKDFLSIKLNRWPMPSKNCPLCKEKATYKYLTYGMNDKCFTCKNCQSFAIEDQAEEHLNKCVQQNLHALLSEKSKRAEAGKVLFIQYVGGTGTENVDTEYVEKAFLD